MALKIYNGRLEPRPFYINLADDYDGGRLQQSYRTSHHQDRPMPAQDAGRLFGVASNSPAASSSQTTCCPRCGTVVMWTDLKQHMFLAHQIAYYCDLCDKSFLTVSGLTHHRSAHGGRKFTCPICDYKFKHKWHLKNHLKSVHKHAQCPVCSQLFGIGNEFNQHILHCR